MFPADVTSRFVYNSNKLDGISLRVPTPTGSITDLVAVLRADASIDAINDAFSAAAGKPSYRGVLEYTDLPQYHRGFGYASRDGQGTGWWLVDWPDADNHFSRACRLTAFRF